MLWDVSKNVLYLENAFCIINLYSYRIKPQPTHFGRDKIRTMDSKVSNHVAVSVTVLSIPSSW